MENEYPRGAEKAIFLTATLFGLSHRLRFWALIVTMLEEKKKKKGKRKNVPIDIIPGTWKHIFPCHKHFFFPKPPYQFFV